MIIKTHQCIAELQNSTSQSYYLQLSSFYSGNKPDEQWAFCGISPILQNANTGALPTRIHGSQISGYSPDIKQDEELDEIFPLPEDMSSACIVFSPPLNS